MTDLQPNLPLSLGRSGPFDESPQELYLDLDVLAQDVGIIGIFSDWPATVTFYANCMGL